MSATGVDECVSWPSGALGPCDECGRMEVLHGTDRDYLDEAQSYQCRCCMTNHACDGYDEAEDDDLVTDGQLTRHCNPETETK